MFPEMLRMQWQWLRMPLLVLALCAVVVPVLAMSSMGNGGISLSIGDLISRGEVVGGVIALLAVVIGLVAGHVLWTADDRVGHVYALSMPISRHRFIWWRAAGGLLILVVPAFAVWVGALAATAMLDLPSTLHAYTGWFALRSYAAMALTFAAFFLFRFGLSRRARTVAVAVALAWMSGWFIETEVVERRDGPISRVSRTLLAPASPLTIVFSRWPLVDV
jgi:hypothetical protein